MEPKLQMSPARLCDAADSLTHALSLSCDPVDLSGLCRELSACSAAHGPAFSEGELLEGVLFLARLGYIAFHIPE